MKESQTIEFKRCITENLKYEVIAFANTAGGTIYIGIDDDGTPVGIEDMDESMLSVTNTIRDSILPDITLFTDVRESVIGGKPVIEIIVQRGSQRPYFIKGKGIRPEGVYIRHGASSVPASHSAILRMIKASSDDDYEETDSLRQDLTFLRTEKAFRDKGLRFTRTEMKTLGLMMPDGIYTNLAFLLSDQCSHTIKAAVFEGDTKAIFRDRREFTGSLLMQLEDAYSFLDQYNRTRSEFDGLSRIDRRDYPTQAIREALMNALVHREYALPGPILISIYDNRIEITTPGGLVNELTLDDVMLGVSILRNRNLGNVFYRLELIEAYGTGIARIMESYEPDTDKPRIDVSDNAFRITLPNRNSKSTKKKEGIVSRREQVVIDLFDDHGTISRKDIEKALGVSQATAILIARDMVDKEILLKENGGKYLRYRLNDTW